MAQYLRKCARFVHNLKLPNAKHYISRHYAAYWVVLTASRTRIKQCKYNV